MNLFLCYVKTLWIVITLVFLLSQVFNYLINNKYQLSLLPSGVNRFLIISKSLTSGISLYVCTDIQLPVCVIPTKVEHSYASPGIVFRLEQRGSRIT